jgi:translation initiation factor IF-3
MEILGKIKVLNPEQQVSPTFKKREVVVATDEQYPQSILVEFIQDKVDLLNNFMIGDPVKISINLRGREWTSPQGEVKYFNSIHGWRIEKMTSQAAAPTQAAPSNMAPPMPAANTFAQATDFNDSEPDDLPF